MYGLGEPRCKNTPSFIWLQGFICMTLITKVITNDIQ